MPRLIDVDELAKFPIRLNHYDRINGNEHYVFGIEAVLEYAENLPTIDAEPVRHGRWIDRGDYVTTAYGSLDLKICSECNAEVTLDGYDYYCPNCGAKMDLEVQDESGCKTGS